MEGDASSMEEFLAKYGDRGYYVLKSMLEASLRGGAKLGDFSLKDLKDKLTAYGLDYNPVPLLYALEKNYGIIRTSYRSSNQHWWVILRRRDVEEAIAKYEGKPVAESEDYKLKLLKIQFYSLNPQRLLMELRAASRRGDKSAVAREAFTTLPLLVEFLEKAKSQYPDELSSEIGLAEEIIRLAEEIVTPRYAGTRSNVNFVAEPQVNYDSL
ncbi:hypothetical protein [Acidilobus saccharovorans]|uniref:hypothetical protein n=1 Tax=Acidilobus saccharovorans TaxID=242703 RepID=UPI0011D0E9E0|nr:hypothetical protein [Acidilobus saccharovorans]